VTSYAKLAEVSTDSR